MLTSDDGTERSIGEAWVDTDGVVTGVFLAKNFCCLDENEAMICICRSFARCFEEDKIGAEGDAEGSSFGVEKDEEGTDTPLLAER